MRGFKIFGPANNDDRTSRRLAKHLREVLSCIKNADNQLTIQPNIATWAPPVIYASIRLADDSPRRPLHLRTNRK